MLYTGFWGKTFYLASKFLIKEEEQRYAELQILASEAARKGETAGMLLHHHADIDRRNDHE